MSMCWTRSLDFWNKTSLFSRGKLLKRYQAQQTCEPARSKLPMQIQAHRNSHREYLMSQIYRMWLISQRATLRKGNILTPNFPIAGRIPGAERGLKPGSQTHKLLLTQQGSTISLCKVDYTKLSRGKEPRMMMKMGRISWKTKSIQRYWHHQCQPMTTKTSK